MKQQRASGWWIENLLRPVMIAGMLVCQATPIVLLMEALARAPDGSKLWNGTYFLIFAFLASLEGILSERMLQRRRITGWAYLGSRAAELLILLLLLKLLNYIPLGLNYLRTDAMLWATNPYHFISNRDFFMGLLFVPLWVGSLYMARMVQALDVEDHEEAPPADKTSPEYYMWLTRPRISSRRQERLTWLSESFLWGGILILVTSTGLYLLAPSVGAPAVAILLYFALAVTLLSQARFSVTNASWQAQGISVQPGIGRRWLLWVAIFIIGVALLALLLPTTYTMGPLRVLLGLISIVYTVLTFVLGLLMFLLTLPLLWLFPKMEQPPQPEMGPLGFPPPDPGAAGGSWPWLEILASGIFWIVVLAIVVFALRRFLKDRWSILSGRDDLQVTWWGRILAWLRDLWRRWRGWGQDLQQRLSGGRVKREEAASPVARISRFFFPGRLPPRALICYFYLSTTRRASQAGRSREPGETPYEYQSTLDRQFPELEPDLEGLTDAFVKARYSQRPVEAGDAAAIKPLWQRIKAALQRRRIQH
jgi:hypothetical protein